MTKDEHIEEVGMSMDEVLKQFCDRELEKQICKSLGGRSVMVAYTTLCYIIAVCISRSSESEEAAQHAMDMCSNMVAAIATADHNTAIAQKEAGDDDEQHTPTTRLQ